MKSVNGSTGYLLDTDYSALGQPQQLVLGTAATDEHRKAYITNTYEEGTGRLTGSDVTDQTHPYTLQSLKYSFDDAGNITAISDGSTLGGTGAPARSSTKPRPRRRPRTATKDRRSMP